MSKNKEIKLNERLSILRDSNGGWRLHEKTNGINPKTKQPTESVSTTYHGKLTQVFSAAIERECGLAGDLQEMIEIIEQAKRDIKSVVEFMLSES